MAWASRKEGDRVTLLSIGSGYFSSQIFPYKYPSIFQNYIFYTYLPMKMEQSVPKRRHMKFRHGGITQKKTYNTQNKAKIWNQERVWIL
jgi:hypothetical protein